MFEELKQVNVTDPFAYKYINIVPKAAPLDQVCDGNSAYSEGVAAETALALAAPRLLIACEDAPLIPWDPSLYVGYSEEAIELIRTGFNAAMNAVYHSNHEWMNALDVARKPVKNSSPDDNECGLSPRQLLEQRDALLVALQGLRKQIHAHHLLNVVKDLSLLRADIEAFSAINMVTAPQMPTSQSDDRVSLKWIVSVARTGYGMAEIEVDVGREITAAEAEDIARDKAGDISYSEHSSEYSVEGLRAI